jgi:hypothetical protein
MPGSWLHLAKRFFGSIDVHDLDATEIQVIRDLVSSREFALFMEQQPLDRRHGFESAQYAIGAGATNDVVRAAALHDVAKRHARLGVVGRVIASVCIKLGIPVRGRVETYRRHGQIGAEELERAGSPPIVVEYTRSHHGVAPPGFDPAVWGLLSAADEAGERSQSVRSDR